MQARGNVILDTVVTPNFVEHFIDEPRDLADALDKMLTLKALRGLRAQGGKVI